MAQLYSITSGPNYFNYYLHSYTSYNKRCSSYSSIYLHSHLMKKDKKFKKIFFIYTIFLIPTILLSGEFFIFILTTYLGLPSWINRGSNQILPNKTIDLISGLNRYKPTAEDLQNEKAFLNRHGLIKTIYNSNKEEKNKVYGIGIIGNSVAVGYPLTVNGEFEKSFVNLLEKNLRKANNQFDIINLSNHGFNSWQEFTQLARYLNSNFSHNDLPNLKLVASIGGIQDFWGFINFVHPMNNESSKEFYKANGLMSLRSDSQDLFFQEIYKAANGDLKPAIKFFLSSIKQFFIKKSYLYNFYKYLQVNIRSLDITDNTKKEFSNYKILKLDEIIASKLKISRKNYEKKKNIVTESVSRNISSIINLNKEGKNIFIYLPTRFSSSKIQTNPTDRYHFNNLNINDLNVLEKDYRNNLLRKLNNEKDLKVYNLANEAQDHWFVDESHFSKKGHAEIEKLIYPIFINILELKD